MIHIMTVEEWERPPCADSIVVLMLHWQQGVKGVQEGGQRKRGPKCEARKPSVYKQFKNPKEKGRT